MKEQLFKIAKNPLSASAIVGVITFGAGAGVGYILGRRNKYQIFEPPPRVGLVLNAEDLAELEANDHILEDEDEDETEEDEEDESEEDSDELVASRNGVSARDFIAQKLNEPLAIIVDPEPEEVEVEPVPSNIFAGNTDNWNYKEESVNRNPEEPYVIHEDEFHNDERGFHQSTLYWYASDEILSDEQNQPIYNHREVIGPLLFGHGSADPNVFFVRNEKTRSEWEIIFEPGYFREEVLGHEIEDGARAQDVKHSNSPRRFQMD